MKPTEQLGKIKIHLPNENSSQFYIFQDIAELFGLEYQGDAVSKLRKELKSQEFKPIPSIDYEADNASIRTSSAKSIFQTVKLINKLTISKFKISEDSKIWEDLYEKLICWKRPKPQKWTVGDLFTFQLKDDSFVFGQIIGKHPTCALFNLKSKTHFITDNEIRSARIITILHLIPTKLNDFSWKILRNMEILASKDSGPWGSDEFRIGHKSASPNHLEDVAQFFWFKEHNWNDVKNLEDLIMKEKGFLNRLFKRKK